MVMSPLGIEAIIILGEFRFGQYGQIGDWIFIGTFAADMFQSINEIFNL